MRDVIPLNSGKSRDDREIMRKANAVYLIALGLLVSMCTARKPAMQSQPMQEPKIAPVHRIAADAAEAGYGGSLAPMFYYTEGLKASEIRGDRQEAAELFEKAMKADSSHSPSYFAAANNIVPLNQKLALRYSRRANELDPANEWYRTQLANLLVMEKDYSGALTEYTELLKLAPNNPENYRMLAALYEVRQQPFSALAVLDTAEVKFGRLEALTNYKRELYLKLNLFDKAIEESLGMIGEYPYNYQNYLIAGDLYMMRGRDSLATVNLMRAAELNPGGLDVQGSLANYYRSRDDMVNFFAVMQKMYANDQLDVRVKTGMFRDLTRDRQFYGDNYYAMTSLITTLYGRYPDNYEIMEFYAQNLLGGGETEEGLAVYKNYITDTTSVAAPFETVIDGEAYLGRTDSVNKYSRMAIERFPDNVDMYLKRGAALSYMKDHKGALAVYEKALKLPMTDSLRSVVYCYAGDVYHQMGDDRRCFRDYDKALALDKDNVLALNNYAYFLSLTGKDLDKALSMATRVMELEPGDPTYIDTYGWVLYKMGRYEQAKKVMQQAVSLDRRASKELLVHYGDVLFAMDDFFMAKYYWEKAQEAGYDETEIAARMKKLEGK